jgi:hypothetical protein
MVNPYDPPKTTSEIPPEKEKGMRWGRIFAGVCVGLVTASVMAGSYGFAAMILVGSAIGFAGSKRHAS